MMFLLHRCVVSIHVFCEFPHQNHLFPALPKTQRWFIIGGVLQMAHSRTFKLTWGKIKVINWGKKIFPIKQLSSFQIKCHVQPQAILKLRNKFKSRIYGLISSTRVRGLWVNNKFKFSLPVSLKGTSNSRKYRISKGHALLQHITACTDFMKK